MVMKKLNLLLLAFLVVMGVTFQSCDDGDGYSLGEDVYKRQAYLLQNDLNLKSSEIISTLVYKQGILQGNIGYATAVGLMNSCLNLLLIILANKFCKRFFDTSLW